MSESIKLPLEHVLELIEVAVFEKHQGNTRWGSRTFYVFQYQDKFWSVTLQQQPEMGLMETNEDPIECDRVMSKKEIITVTTWVPYIKS